MMSEQNGPREENSEGELADEELDQVSGGVSKKLDGLKSPSPPGGPVPIPYPNVGTKV